MYNLSYTIVHNYGSIETTSFYITFRQHSKLIQFSLIYSRESDQPIQYKIRSSISHDTRYTCTIDTHAQCTLKRRKKRSWNRAVFEESLRPAPLFESERISLISRSIVTVFPSRFSRSEATRPLIARLWSNRSFSRKFFSQKGAMGRNSIDNCSLGLLIALAAAVVTGFNWNTRVTTKFGDIKGLWSRSTRGRLVAHYLGIPYAQPPLGDLRFRVSLLYSFFFFFLLAQREFLEKYFRGSWFVVEADFVKCLSLYYIFTRF